jgi:hypothetical protein
MIERHKRDVGTEVRRLEGFRLFGHGAKDDGSVARLRLNACTGVIRQYHSIFFLFALQNRLGYGGQARRSFDTCAGVVGENHVLDCNTGYKQKDTRNKQTKNDKPTKGKNGCLGFVCLELFICLYLVSFCL